MGPSGRRLLLLCSAIVLVDTIFFAALTPLLPHYADEFGLSKTAAGVLTAAYAAGGVICALPAGWVASRAGVRTAVLLGLALMIGTSVAFGFATSSWALIAARFGQGVGSSLSWNGALAWLVAATPRERRGQVIGTAMGAAVGGALLGPVLGGAASLFGTAPAFSAVAALGLALAAWAWTTPAEKPEEPQPLRDMLRAIRSPRVAFGFWLITLAALLFGAIAVLAPLHLAAVGFGALGIGVIWLVSTAIETAANPLLGRWADARGRLAPVRAGLTLAVIFSLVLPWMDERWLAVVIVVATLVSYGFFWVPGMVILSEGTEDAGLEHALGVAILNLAWAPGHVAGSAFGAALADATSDAASYLLLAAICLATLLAVELRPAARVAPARGGR